MPRSIKQTLKEATEAEAELTAAVGEHRQRAPLRLLSAYAKLGDQPELRVISGSVILAGLVTANGRLFRAGIRMLLAHEVTTAAKNLVKGRVIRTRPRSASARRDAHPRKGKDTAKAQSSFPSGHSAGAIAVAQAFAREYPEHRAVALAAAGAIAVGQVPKAAHYPSDVVAGMLLGVATEAALGATWKAVDHGLAEPA